MCAGGDRGASLAEREQIFPLKQEPEGCQCCAVEGESKLQPNHGLAYTGFNEEGRRGRSCCIQCTGYSSIIMLR